MIIYINFITKKINANVKATIFQISWKFYCMQKSKRIGCTRYSAPVYDKPNFNGSCLTEVYESCIVIDKNTNWFYIECEDGYKGW